jgi:hypothetical protein
MITKMFQQDHVEVQLKDTYLGQRDQYLERRLFTIALFNTPFHGGACESKRCASCPASADEFNVCPRLCGEGLPWR